MSQCIWVSNALSGSINQAGFLTDLIVEDRKKAFENNVRNQKGEPLSAEFFPKKAWLLPEDAKRKKRADFGITGSFAFMSEKCAEIFRCFDLGNGSLYPLEFFEADRVTRLPGNWFSINFGNVKPCFLPDRSSDYMPVPGKKFSPFAGWPDEALVFHPDALNGTDIWIDPILFECFCLSEGLAAALSEVGLLGVFDPVKRGKIVR